MFIENARSVLEINVILQSDFSNKAKGQTERGKHVDKRTVKADRYTINIFTGFTGRYGVAQK